MELLTLYALVYIAWIVMFVPMALTSDNVSGMEKVGFVAFMIIAGIVWPVVLISIAIGESLK